MTDHLSTPAILRELHRLMVDGAPVKVPPFVEKAA